MNYFHKKQSAGFTLIELLVVIAIIGLLSAVVLQSIQSARLKSQNATRLANIDQIDKAIQLYMTKTNSSLPSTGGNFWQCVGLTAGNCWGNVIYTPATNLNSALLAGNMSFIPKDPTITTGTGDYYLYNGAWATTTPGAYITWFSYNTGSAPCGRGYTFGASSGAYQQCALFLGKD